VGVSLFGKGWNALGPAFPDTTIKPPSAVELKRLAKVLSFQLPATSSTGTLLKATLEIMGSAEDLLPGMTVSRLPVPCLFRKKGGGGVPVGSGGGGASATASGGGARPAGQGKPWDLCCLGEFIPGTETPCEWRVDEVSRSGSSSSITISVIPSSLPPNREGREAAIKAAAAALGDLFEYSARGMDFWTPITLTTSSRMGMVYEDVVSRDVNSIWEVDEMGERKESSLGLVWKDCNASHEWTAPSTIEDKRRYIYLSQPTLSRTGQQYSHQLFRFTVNRKRDHYLLTIFLPFFTLTSSVALVMGVDQTDLNTRITLLGSFFVAQLSLRFVTASYIPKISYSTKLDNYITACLLFTIAAIVLVVAVKNLAFHDGNATTVFSGSSTPTGPTNATSAFTFSYTSATYPFVLRDGATFTVGSPLPFSDPRFSDKVGWLCLMLLWGAFNAYFSQFFLGKNEDARRAAERVRHKRIQRHEHHQRAGLSSSPHMHEEDGDRISDQYGCISFKNAFLDECCGRCGRKWIPKAGVGCLVRAWLILSHFFYLFVVRVRVPFFSPNLSILFVSL